MKPRLEQAIPKMQEVMQKQGSRLLRYAQVRDVIQKNRQVWRLAQTTSLKQIIAFLKERGVLTEAVLDFPARKETRYSLQKPDVYELVMSLNPKGYFSHYTAMSLHELTDQIPKNVYFNVEQSPKPAPVEPLVQDRIDAAFARAPRRSSNTAAFGDLTVTVLSGMHTGAAGIISLDVGLSRPLSVAGVERTLIDSAVRPFYSGGVFEVLNAYRRARGRFSIRALIELLRDLNYTYPYHQAIGFYLERAGGYDREVSLMLEQFERRYDFWLTHQIRKPEYSARWRLRYPKGL